MNDLTERIRSVFLDAQHPMKARSKLVSMLMKIKNTAKSDEEFFEPFTEHVKHSLVVLNREPAVERTIDFLVSFVSTASKDSGRKSQQPGNFSDDEEEEELMSPFLVKFFNFLLDFHESHLKAVRFRSCQIINKLFNALADNISIDEDLADRIYDCMLIRIRDKFPSIRVQAVMAVYRLQDIEDEECPVINSFINLLENDGNSAVRRAALCNIAITSKALPFILGRTRDVKEVVRKSAFEILSERVSIRSLSIAQRLNLLENGLNDRSQIVKNACTNMLLKAWLVDRDNSIYLLLKCFHVETCPEIVTLTLKALFQGASNDELKKHIEALKSFPQAESETNSVKISHDALDSENAIYWRHLVEHIKSLDNNTSDLIDQVLPLASEFCDYIQKFAESHRLTEKGAEEDEIVQQNEFIMQQMLHLCGCFDYSDEIGRKRLQTLTRSLLISENVPFSLVENLIARFYDTGPSEDEFTQSLVEIISEIKEPMVVEEISEDEIRKKKIEVAKLKVELNEMKETLDESVRTENFTKAAEVKELIAKLEKKIEEASQTKNRTVRVENNDALSIYKCLHIAKELLQKVKKTELTPTLANLATTLIWPSVQEKDALIRNMAVKCLGLCSLRCKDFASENFVLFLQAAQIDIEMVKITAIQTIFDLILVYGFGTFNVTEAQAKPITMRTNSDEGDSSSNDGDAVINEIEDNEETATTTSDVILNALITLLDGESPDIRFAIVEGMCKWLFCGIIRSVKMFSRLVLLWYNPAVEDDVKLRHCLGVFLPAFAFASRANQELIEESFLPILDTLFNAPDTSPLTEVKPLSVVELLVQLANSKNFEKNAVLLGRKINTVQESNVHDSLAERVANEILSNNTNCDIRILCKVLTMLEISPANQDAVRALQVMCTRMLEEVADKVSIKLLQKFQVGLRLIDRSENLETDNVDLTANQQTTDVLEEVEENADDNTDTRSPPDASDEISMNVTSKNIETVRPITETTSDQECEDPIPSRRKTRSISARMSEKQTASRLTASTTGKKSQRTKRSSKDGDHSSENKSQEEPANEPRYPRRLSSRTAKKAELEKAKLNLESVLDEDCDDSKESTSSDSLQPSD